jgi:hypothetical protein
MEESILPLGQDVTYVVISIKHIFGTMHLFFFFFFFFFGTMHLEHYIRVIK